ncbi:Rtt107p KNAG_0E00570 [Huiozyma naganishii CBS 8797]|uniref:BRCT domain-containing protein n=1 Tax=Huiozyma naganishii (strain ATCC MYA-139 / BCRC 22969 / CBS 8797 / KCTC 17520 / NBRC 10181 / NCYC 3082 / Yp74L-3) TaxID=1071383 RepID=J7R641_HUIN7|nr:hypothetical protein KNAG_0E00570 [Kazachstania naganishii CBS 8797]CCK70325.1 hypothetical protein KNAG_0E00570 [Kazachstania naganishii CBS 8797]
MNSETFKHLNILVIDTAGSGNGERVKKLLQENGVNNCYTWRSNGSSTTGDSAKQFFKTEWGSKDLHFVVSDTTNFPFYRCAAFDYMIPVVTPDWVRHSLNSKKLAKTVLYSPDARHFLKDSVICLPRKNFKYTEYLLYSELIICMGGSHSEVLSSKTTHYICKTKDDPIMSKIADYINSKPDERKKWNFKVVYPMWIIHCFKKGQLVDNISNISCINANEHYDEDERCQDIWDEVLGIPFQEPKRFLQGHEFIIDIDLALARGPYTFLLQYVENCSGSIKHHLNSDEITSNVTADCFIAQSEKTSECQTSRRTTLMCGNLIWLFNMWSLDSFTLPSSKIIWGPLKQSVVRSDELILSFTNYFGLQRSYIQRITERLGGVSTTSLTKRNTHLVSRMAIGKKFELAKQWGGQRCRVVNHLWLEECYRQKRIMDTEDPRFQNFEVGKMGLDFSLGQMSDATENKDIVLQLQDSDNESLLNWNESDSTASTTIPSPVKETSRGVDLGTDAVTMRNIDEDDLGTASPEELEVGTAKPNPTTNIPDDHNEGTEDVPVHGDVVEEHVPASILPNYAEDGEFETAPDKYADLFSNLSQTSDDRMGGVEQAKPKTEELTTPIASRQTFVKNTVHDPTGGTPTASKKTYVKTTTQDPNADTPITPPTEPALSGVGRRQARAEAEKRLHTDIEALNAFQKNSKRKRIGDLLPEEIEQLESVKRVNNEARDIVCQLNKDSTVESETFLKTVRHTYSIVAYITGCLDDMTALDKAILKLVGIKIVKHENEHVRHLNCIVAPKVMRTAKFLISLSFKPLKYVLLPQFISDVLNAVSRGASFPLDFERYVIPGFDMTLVDRTSLPTAVFERAHITHVNVMGDIRGGFDVISHILQKHGVQDIHKLRSLPDDTLVANNHHRRSKTIVSGKKTIHTPPLCVVMGAKKSQVAKLKKLWTQSNDSNTEGLFVISWDWCVDTLFRMDVDYSKSEHVLFSSL